MDNEWMIGRLMDGWVGYCHSGTSPVAPVLMQNGLLMVVLEMAHLQINHLLQKEPQNSPVAFLDQQFRAAGTGSELKVNIGTGKLQTSSYNICK